MENVDIDMSQFDSGASPPPVNYSNVVDTAQIDVALTPQPPTVSVNPSDSEVVSVVVTETQSAVVVVSQRSSSSGSTSSVPPQSPDVQDDPGS